VINIFAGHVGLIELHGHVTGSLMVPGPLPLAPVELGEIGDMRFA
jgi:hypothetical protein